MKKIFLLAAFLLLILFIFLSSRPSGNLWVPYEYGKGIRVITSGGKTIMELVSTLPPKYASEKEERFIGEEFYHADVHPDQSRILCVRLRHEFKRRKKYWETFKRDYEIIEVVPNDGKFDVHVIYAAPAEVRINDPVYSPDGKKIAFVAAHESVYILDRQNRLLRQIYKFNKKDFIFDVGPIENYIRWGKDGERLYMFAGGKKMPLSDETKMKIMEYNECVSKLRKEKKYIDFDKDIPEKHKEGRRASGGQTSSDICEIDPTSGEIKWLEIYGIWFYGGRMVPGRGWWDYDKLRRSTAPLPNIPAVQALFGSSKYPVERPIWGPNRRYYFYRAHRGGFGAKGWIGQYDTLLHRSKTIKLLWRRFYSDG